MKSFVKILFMIIFIQNMLYAEKVKLVKKGGVYSVPIMINDSIKLNFVVDSGAARVSMPYDVFRTLIRTGTIKKDDILGTEQYRMANGDIVEGTVVNLRAIKIGSLIVTNVLASVDKNMEGMLLLGQSALEKLEPWHLDTAENIIYLKENNLNKKIYTTTNKISNSYKHNKKNELVKLCSQKDGIACLEIGKRYWSKKDYPNARTFFSQACSLNVDLGCERLASLYQTNEKVTKEGYTSTTDSFTKNYFIKACQDGLAGGCHGLGSVFEDERDYNQANAAFFKACSLDNAQGCYELAMNYRDGYGNMKKNIRMANQYFEKSCNLGYRCELIGTIYEHGYSVSKNYSKAMDYYTKSCSLDEALGCYRLGLMYQKGKGVPQNNVQAVKFFKKACVDGNSQGCQWAGFMYSIGQGVKKDYLKGKMYYKKACDGDLLLGCSSLGMMYVTGENIPQDYSKAKELFTKACDGGDNMGCSNLGHMYFNGYGVAQDYQVAAKLYNKSCEANYADACSSLALMYSKGQGVKKDLSKAVSLVKKACIAGDKKACSLIEKRLKNRKEKTL